MADLQAAVDFTVELGSFFNIDLFQRGFYQIRVGMKSFSSRTPYKVDVSLPKKRDCDLIHPACLINGVAVSKTFQIMYKNEDVLLNDLIYFKVQMLVDSNKLEECIEKSGLQLIIELWFNEEDAGTDSQDKFECVCSRAHTLNFHPSKGLHTHVSIMFDYFYLSAIGVTVHGSLVAVHQPIYNPRQPNMSWPIRGNTLSTLESVLFTAKVPPSVMQLHKHAPSPSLQSANYMFRLISQILLSAYESLQSTLTKLWRIAGSSKSPVSPVANKDCKDILSEMCKEVEKLNNEEDFLQYATSKIAHLCAYNVVLWDKFVELFGYNIRAAKHLAREYHSQRVKRFAEGFFTLDMPKSALTDCYEPSTHGHVDLASRIRSSVYFQSLPSLPLECPELDGDGTTLPIIFEEVFSDSMERAISGTDISVKSDETSTGSAEHNGSGSEAPDGPAAAASTAAAASAPPHLQRSRKVIRNVRPYTLRRPGSYALEEAASAASKGQRWGPGVDEHYFGKEQQPQLIGFKKLSSDCSAAPLADATAGAMASAGGAPHYAFLSEPLSPLRRSLLMPQRSASPASAVVAPSSSGNKNVPAAVIASRCDAGVVAVQSSPLRRRGSSRRLQRSQPAGGSLPDLSPSKLIAEENSSGDGSSCEDDESSSQPQQQQQKEQQLGVMRRAGSTRSTGASVSGARCDGATVTSAGRSSGNWSWKTAERARRERLAFDFASVHSGGDSVGGADTVSLAGAALAAADINSPVPGDGKTLHGLSAEPAATAAAPLVIAIGAGHDITVCKAEKSPPDVTDVGEEALVADPAIFSAATPPSATPAVSCSDVSLIVSDNTDGQGAAAHSDSGVSKHSMCSSHSISVLATSSTRSSMPSQAGKQLPVPEILICTHTVVHGSLSTFDLPTSQAGSSRSSTVADKSIISVGMTQSKSAPGLMPPAGHQQQQQQRRPSGEPLVRPFADAMLSFLTAKEELKLQLKFSGHLYSDFASLPSSTPYFWLPGRREHDDMHLIIGVHGLDGNNQDLRLVRTYLEIAMPGDRIDFLMSESNKDTFVDFETMTEKLVNEILHHLDMYSELPARISFVGHSLGNIIIRSALGHPKLKHILPNLHTYLSLSGPHLGTLYGQSGLVNMGMWVIQKLKKSSSLLQLSLRDKLDLRDTFIYKLSQQAGLEFFKNVLLVSSPQDKYAPYHSTRIENCRAAARDSSVYGKVYTEMVKNLLDPVVRRPHATVVRYDVHYALPGGANSVIGRAAHIAVLDSELFLEKFVTVSALKYFK